MSNFKFSFFKNIALLSQKFVKLVSNANSFPGYLFFKFTSFDGLKYLGSQLSKGSLLVTGTNGKTTTTTILTKLFEEDMEITKSFENNTIYAVMTSLLNSKSDLGVFEYGIRGKEYAFPDSVQKYLDPKCVLYTNISREHVQILNVKNSFNEYFDAKFLLSKDMDKGVVVVNSDNPFTNQIGLLSSDKVNNDFHINSYGFDCDMGSTLVEPTVECPVCGKPLNYSKYFVSTSGIYSCDCGFSRIEPNIKVTNVKLNESSSIVTIKGEVYNCQINDTINIDLDVNLPLFGVHNIYNVLAAITAYLSFTPNPDVVNKTIKKICDTLDFSILPPGRFELISSNNKLIGIGQGDNGGAFSANAQLMTSYVKGGLDFIYTTPDEYEDEIFYDHLEVIRSVNPEHLICVPGRNSVEQARKYFDVLKEEFNAEFYPLSVEELDKKINTIVDLACNSKFDFVFISGCGEEQKLWDKIKNDVKKA